MSKKKVKDERQPIVIRLAPKERILAEKLAQYLYQHNLVKRASINEAVRYSLLYLGYVISNQVRERMNKSGGEYEE